MSSKPFGGLGGRDITYDWADTKKIHENTFKDFRLKHLPGEEIKCEGDELKRMVKTYKNKDAMQSKMLDDMVRDNNKLENKIEELVAESKKQKELIKELEDRQMHSFLDTIPLHQDDEEDERWIKF